eukprot:1763009-Pyramimonas_sp.AAC.1
MSKRACKIRHGSVKAPPRMVNSHAPALDAELVQKLEHGLHAALSEGHLVAVAVLPRPVLRAHDAFSVHSSALSIHSSALSIHLGALIIHSGALNIHSSALSIHSGALSIRVRPYVT